MPRRSHRSVQPDSLQWAAERIRRILEREEQEQARKRRAPSAASETDSDADLLKTSFPVGSTGWAAQRIRRILDREEGITPAASVPSQRFKAPGTDQYDSYGYDDLVADIPEYIGSEYEKYTGVNAALSEMVGSQLPGRERGPADAYRHILWAAELTRRFGEDRAREILDLHEREGELRGQAANEQAMDVSNNEIGIRIGAFARDFKDVISAARKVISGSAPNGSGAWKPGYDPTSTLAPHAAHWLPENQWAKNPVFDRPVQRPTMSIEHPEETPVEQTNWYSNPNRRNGPDWAAGYVPDGYSYPYSGPQHATGPNDAVMRRAAAAYRFLVDRPWLLNLKDWIGRQRSYSVRIERHLKKRPNALTA